MAQNERPLLKVEHLRQYFKSGKKNVKAVDDVSFEVYRGEVFGLVGESGCGKTTTGRSIIRLYNVSGGSVYFDGVRICAGTGEYTDAIAAEKAKYKQALKDCKKNMSAEDFGRKKAELKAEADKAIAEQKALMAKAQNDHKNCNKLFAEQMAEKVAKEYDQKIADAADPQTASELEEEKKQAIAMAKRDRIMNKIQMIFQDPIASLDPRMTVYDTIAEGLKVRGIKDKARLDEIVFDSLELVGLLPEHASRYPHEFSGGQRQRIGIARAIALEPEIIIADEPISALDVSIQAQVINLLNKLRRKKNLTILFISHDLSVVKYFSDRIAVMYFGRIVEMAASSELFEHPLHPYTKSLLSAIPLPDPDTEKLRQRTSYNPLKDHDYSVEAPALREIVPGHFISCNSEEFERYKKEFR